MSYESVFLVIAGIVLAHQHTRFSSLIKLSNQIFLCISLALISLMWGRACKFNTGRNTLKIRQYNHIFTNFVSEGIEGLMLQQNHKCIKNSLLRQRNKNGSFSLVSFTCCGGVSHFLNLWEIHFISVI